MQQFTLPLQKKIPLSQHTTIGLGGKAAYFVSCQSIGAIRDSLAFAKAQNLRVEVLGGGSNIIFPDEGFDGLILKVSVMGSSSLDDGKWMQVGVAAGEPWDEFVKLCVIRGWAGVECLSGIPGLVGATPIQNVGAYGQEVGDTITNVKAIDSTSFQFVEFTGKECNFGYRQSRFKTHDLDRYVIVEVTFRLRKDGRPEVRYPELRKYIESNTDLAKLDSGTQALDAVRSAVLALRRSKSMVIDPADPNSRSVGSFFMNPILPARDFKAFEERWKSVGDGSPLASFPAEEYVKIPAAWLVEKTGYHKGYRKGNVGISSNHSLALINCGDGTTRELLELAREIQSGVFEKFGIRLEQEPVVVK
jgi:UDP-N-acetylmuramate dehydrogenase